MYIENDVVHFRPGHLLMLAAGNTLFTQRTGQNALIKSTIIYFDDLAVRKALQTVPSSTFQKSPRAFKLFECDSYLYNYMDSVNVLLEQKKMSPALQEVKLNELLL